MTGERNPPKQRGCLFYGVLILAFLGLLLLVLIGATYYTVRTTIQSYTEAGPILLEQADYPQDRMQALERQIASFRKALDARDSPAELTLSAEDLNALIAKEPDLRGRLRVQIDDDRLKGEVSFRLPDVGVLNLKGRYLNGAAILQASLADGRLSVNLKEVTVKGKPLPGFLLAELKKQNLAEEWQKTPQTTAAIAKFESIQITNGQVILRNKAVAGNR